MGGIGGVYIGCVIVVAIKICQWLITGTADINDSNNFLIGAARIGIWAGIIVGFIIGAMMDFHEGKTHIKNISTTTDNAV